MKFGITDRRDFLLPPFALFYFYIIFASAFHFDGISEQKFFRSIFFSWIGVALCVAGLLFLLLSLVSFGRSFRIGVDTTSPDRLVTSGIFSVSRNPIYVGFVFILIGQFFIFPNWILLLFALAGIWMCHRQILIEENFLQKYYGREYDKYCQRVRRYI